MMASNDARYSVTWLPAGTKAKAAAATCSYPGISAVTAAISFQLTIPVPALGSHTTSAHAAFSAPL